MTANLGGLLAVFLPSTDPAYNDRFLAAEATYHPDDWLRQLERGQAGAAFFRWWWDQNVAPQLGGRGALFHTGFDPSDVVPVEDKKFLNEGGNLPDFAFVRRQDRRADVGNVIASFSVNLQKKPYDMHSGALAAGCYGCPAITSCYEKKSPRIWVNVHHQRDSQRIEERWKAPDFRVAIILRSPEKLRDAVVVDGLHDSLMNYLRGGLPAVSVPEHAIRLEQLDQVGYKRGRHKPQIAWFRTNDPVFSNIGPDYYETKVSTRNSPRRVHCISQNRAGSSATLAATIIELAAKAREPETST